MRLVPRGLLHGLWCLSWFTVGAPPPPKAWRKVTRFWSRLDAATRTADHMLTAQATDVTYEQGMTS